MPWILRWRTLAAFGSLLLSAGIYSQPGNGADQPSLPPQQQPAQDPVYQSSTVLRATTRLVVLDVVATGSDGAPEQNLKAEDFTVLENGKPQKISGFTFQHGNVVTQAALSANSQGFSNAPQFKN